MPQSLPHPLGGQHILVTRPAGQAATLINGIERLGGRATHIPFLAINPLRDLRDLEKITDRLAAYQACVFVSANAVLTAWPVLTRHQPWPEMLAAGVVGPGTARALHELGVSRIAQPITQFDSEGMLELRNFAPDQCNGNAFALIRGEGGRDVIARTLRERGAQVDEACTYERVLHLEAVNRMQALMLDASEVQEKPSALIVTSSESLTRFMDAAPQPLKQAVTCLCVIAPHARIAATARSLGFEKTIVCRGGDEGILEFLQTYNELSLTDKPGMEAL